LKICKVTSKLTSKPKRKEKGYKENYDTSKINFQPFKRSISKNMRKMKEKIRNNV
jgi:hypothetical protein